METLQRIFDSLDYHVAIYDREWRYSYVNAAAARMLGRPAEELLGRSIWDLFPDAVGNQYYRELHEAVATGRIIHSDHFYPPFGRWFENHIYPQPDGVMVLARDITRERTATEALRQHEEMLRLAQKAGGVATFEWDFAGRTAQCSAEFFRMFGLPERDGIMTVAEWERYLHPADRERMAAHVARVFEGTEPAAADYRINAADGRTRWLTYAGQVRRTPAGARMFGTVVDVTARKEAEAALRAGEEQLRLALDAVQMVAWDWDLETDRVALSPSAAAVLGLTDAVQVQCREEGLARVHPDDREVHERKVREAVACCGSWISEIRFIRPRDGHVIWIEDRGRVRADETGKAVSARGVLVNVTGRVEAQQQARRLAFMLEVTPDFVAMATPDGRVAYLNRAARQMLGIPLDADASSIAQADLYPPWVAERARTEWLPRALRQGAASGEGALLTRDGREIPVSLVLVAHHGPDERMEYVSTIARDISEQRRLEKELRHHAEELALANRLKDEFLATLSHELRTPLNVVRGRVSMLSSATDFDAVARAVEVIERNSVMLERLVGDLLDVARMSHDQLRLEHQRLEPAALVLAALQAAQPAADAKRIAVTSTMAPDLPLLWGDSARLQQVIGNVLSNAVKFTPSGGRVAVDVSADDSAVVIAVEDSGVGIPAEVLPHVFERFWQAESTATRRFGGLGLGLSIARRLVELHGGEIRAESAGLHQGATFTLRLPTAPGRTGGAGAAAATKVSVASD